jgi:hypothetical protein
MRLGFILLFLAAAGCGPSEPPEAFQAVYEAGLIEHLAAAAVAGEETLDGWDWVHFEKSSGPVCLRGGSFSMATQRGSRGDDDLLIYLQGGGACWRSLCLSIETVDPAQGVPTKGMLNRDLAGNGFADWNTVYVPYCDGSLFAGDVDIDDDGDGSIDRFHRGLKNLSAALDIAGSRFKQPKRVVLAGTSAGAYGVYFTALLVRFLYPEAELMVISDGGLGLGIEGHPDFIEARLAEWNIERFVPASCTDCTANGHATRFIDWSLEHDDNLSFTHISSYGDAIIGFYFLGLDAETYGAAVREQTAWLQDQHPASYRRFLFEGGEHTTLAVDSSTDLTAVSFAGQPERDLSQLLGTYDGTKVNGVSVMQWLAGWVGGAGFSSLTD